MDFRHKWRINRHVTIDVRAFHNMHDIGWYLYGFLLCSLARLVGRYSFYSIAFHNAFATVEHSPIEFINYWRFHFTLHEIEVLLSRRMQSRLGLKYHLNIPIIMVVRHKWVLIFVNSHNNPYKWLIKVPKTCLVFPFTFAQNKINFLINYIKTWHYTVDLRRRFYGLYCTWFKKSYGTPQCQNEYEI